MNPCLQFTFLNANHARIRNKISIFVQHRICFLGAVILKKVFIFLTSALNNFPVTRKVNHEHVFVDHYGKSQEDQFQRDLLRRWCKCCGPRNRNWIGRRPHWIFDRSRTDCNQWHSYFDDVRPSNLGLLHWGRLIRWWWMSVGSNTAGSQWRLKLHRSHRTIHCRPSIIGA